MTALAHVERIEVRAEPFTVFAALHTPSAIRAWWHADQVVVLPVPGGVWAASWGEEDNPDYVSTGIIEVFEPPHRLVLAGQRYYSKSEPPEFVPDLTTEFIVTASTNGSTLEVVNEGFPDNEAGTSFLETCAKGWRETLTSLRRFLEAG